MNVNEPLLGELTAEAESTKKLLDRVPEDKLTWKPHKKSMSLGQLALHVAGAPASAVGFLDMREFDGSTMNFQAEQPASKKVILERLDEAVGDAKKALGKLTNEKAMESWKLKVGDQVAFEIPKIGLVRNLMLNHWYHHRGQLTVYLRMLDVPLPSIYGPTADENPFAEMTKA